MTSPGTATPRGATTSRLLTVLLFSALAWFSYRSFLDLSFLGLDTWPMIAASRITSLGDLFGTFSEELMDGYYTDGHFYRPLTNLAFALDSALFGLAPRGWHLTDLAILIANALLVRAVCLRLLGPAAGLAAWVAGLVVLLHPVQIEILPVPARRADTLCLLFLCASWLALPDPRAAGGERRRRALLAGLLASLSLGAKETGAIALPLLFAWQACAHAARGSAWSRSARAALVDSLPAALFFALFLVARTAVLGGIGGHHEGAAGLLREDGLFAFLEGYFARVAYPQPFLGGTLFSARLFLVAALALLAAGAAVVQGAESSAPAARPRAALLFVVLWVACLLAMSSLAGRIHDWYAMLFVAPYALLLGAGLQWGVERVRRAQVAPRRAVGAALALGVLALIGTHVAHTPALRPYPMWSRASDLADAFLERYSAALRSSAAGERVVLDGFVPYLPPKPDGTGIRSAFLLGEYSVQAWSDLVLPEHPAHVDLAVGPSPPPSPGPDVVHVVLVPGRPR